MELGKVLEGLVENSGETEMALAGFSSLATFALVVSSARKRRFKRARRRRHAKNQQDDTDEANMDLKKEPTNLDESMLTAVESLSDASTNLDMDGEMMSLDTSMVSMTETEWEAFKLDQEKAFEIRLQEYLEAYYLVERERHQMEMEEMQTRLVMESERAEQQTKDLTDKVSAQAAELEMTRSNLATLTASHQHLKSAMEFAESELEQEKRLRSRLEDEIMQGISNQASDFGYADQALEETQKELVTLKDEMDGLRAQLAAANEKYGVLIEQFQTKEEELEKAQKLLCLPKNQTMIETQQRMSGLDQQNIKLKEDLEKLKIQLEAARNTPAQTIAPLDNRNESNDHNIQNRINAIEATTVAGLVAAIFLW